MPIEVSPLLIIELAVGGLAAVRAGADEHDLVFLDGVPEPAGDAVDCTLEPRIAERLDLAAVATDEMVMVVAVGGRGLVARDPVAGVDTLHEPELGERLQRAVHRGDPDRPTRLAQPIVDVLRAHAAVLPAEQLDDGLPRAAATITGRLERVECFPCPAHAESVSSRR
jgi:hypothetical protein